MTLETSTFNPSQFELRGYTNPFLTDEQKQAVTLVEDRVNGELDFVAQMLGWSGPNYWNNLATTVDQKRQLLGGTYGVYNNFVIPRIYAIRNWDNTIVIDPISFLIPNKTNYVEYILLGEDKYKIQNVTVEDGRYVVSLGPLPDSFYTQIANNVQLQVNVPSYRPAPFTRSSIGVSGDASFTCGANGTTLVLYPGYSSTFKFPYKFPLLFTGSVYYFDQPIYLSYSSALNPDILPEYDATQSLWYLQIPSNISVASAGLTAYLVWPYSNSSTATNATLQIKIEDWEDPSDWGSESILRNFRGVWNNKGGALPFNFVFDSLSIHGFNERNSLYLDTITRDIEFNGLIEQVYAQRTTISELPPGVPNEGDLWWNSNTGVLATWIPQPGDCTAWVEIDYRVPPERFIYGDVLFTNVAAFIAGASAVPPGTRVSILDVTGLTTTEKVLGVQGTLNAPGILTLYQEPGSPYWTPVEFLYPTVSDFDTDALNLPYQIPVYIGNSNGLSPQGSNYKVDNLDIEILGDYVTILTKFYHDTTWSLSKDSFLKYIANSSLFGSPLQGEMWWDFAVPTPELRCASIYYGTNWVQVNSSPPTAPPAPFLDFSSLEIYCNGALLTPSVAQVTTDYSFEYLVDSVTGLLTFIYSAFTLQGKTQLPSITISDALTTAYTSDITPQVFSGVDYYMSPNVFDAETPLRLWKSQDLQCAETREHLIEDNYINPLLADLNNGPGDTNWERYFVRMPLDYSRKGVIWQKVALTCQDFGYWGSPISPDPMRCPPEESMPAIYEELFLYDRQISDYTYVYCEPYLYSNIAYPDAGETGNLANSGIFPSSDIQFDDFTEAELIEYDPLHNRLVHFDLPVGEGYGNWQGQYVNVNPCNSLSGFLATDLINDGVTPVAPPIWDASVYKCAPTCDNPPYTYTVDANHYKVGYAYFVADASAAEDGFFDVSQEAAWRDTKPQSQSSYLLPR